MPFSQIQCADMNGWTGGLETPGWRKVVDSIAELVGGGAATPTTAARAPLPLPTRPSIAVMPFANLSGDPEQEYFADGMVEEIVNALSRIRSIFVIGSGSTLSFKGRSVSPQDVGRQLVVRYVLEGSVRCAGGRVPDRLSNSSTPPTAPRSGTNGSTTRSKMSSTFRTKWRSPSRPRSSQRCFRRKFSARRAARPKTWAAMTSCAAHRAARLYVHQTQHLARLQRCSISAVALDPAYGQAMAIAAWKAMRRSRCQSLVGPFRSRVRQGQNLARGALEASPDEAAACSSQWPRR